MANNYVVKDANSATLTKSSTDIGGGVEADNVRVCDATAAHFQPTGDALARAIFVTGGDGTNQFTMKATSVLANYTTDTALVVAPVPASDGTHTTPIGDAAARALYVVPSDGTHNATIKAASTLAATTDTGLVVRPLAASDGTHSTPIGDAAARAIYHVLTDGTNGPAAVKPASTSAALTDPALVVQLWPGSNLSNFTQRGLVGTPVSIKASAGHLWALQVSNQDSNPAYIQIFNKLTGSVTPGTTVPDVELVLPPGNTTVQCQNFTFPDGIPFATGISIFSSTASGGGTGSAASKVNVSAQYA